MIFWRNLGVHPRDSLCDVRKYLSAQSLDLLDLAQKFRFLDWKLQACPNHERPEWTRGWA